MRCSGRWVTGFLVAVGIALAAALARAQSPAEASPTPFQGLHGDWAGTGNITLGTGDRERIRCRVNYDVDKGGNSLRQDLRCASDSYKFDMTSDVRHSAGQLNGYWTEHTRRKSGTLYGRALPGRIEALAEASGFSAFFTMITRGDYQTVKIESKSNEVRDVSITLQRAGR